MNKSDHTRGPVLMVRALLLKETYSIMPFGVVVNLVSGSASICSTSATLLLIFDTRRKISAAPLRLAAM